MPAPCKTGKGITSTGMAKYRFAIIALAVIIVASLMEARADNIQVISSKEGISNNAVLSLGQDLKGYIWVGTCDGLNMWDGENMREYPYDWDSVKDLSGRFINRIIKTTDGYFVIQTNHGTDIFDPLSLEVRNYPEIVGGRKIGVSDSEHIIIAQRDRVLYYHADYGTFLPAKVPEEYDFYGILGILVTGDNRIVVFDRKRGILEYGIESDGVSAFLVMTRESRDDGRIAKVYIDANDVFIFNTDGSIYEFDPEDRSLSYIFNLADETSLRGWPSDIIHSGNDVVVAYPTTGALRLRYEAELPGHFVKEDLDVRCGIFKCLKDFRQDIVWMGSDGQGLMKMYGSPFAFKTIRYDEMNRMITMPVRSVFKDGESIWFGTKGDGLLKIDFSDHGRYSGEVQVERFTTCDSELAENSVYAISGSSRDLIWIGNNSSRLNYYSYKDKRLHVLDTGDALCGVHGLYESSPDTLWISTTERGVFMATLSGGDYPVFKEIKKIDFGEEFDKNPLFFAMHPQDSKVLWFGNRGNGVVRYDISTGTYEVLDLSVLGKPIYNDVFAIVTDDDGNVWIGTGSGVVKMEGNNLKTIDETRGAIHALANDGKGNIWASGNNGLYRICSSKDVVQKYGYGSGLCTVEFSDGAVHVDRDGNIYFGGIDGIVIVGRGEGHDQEAFHPKLEFKEMTVNGVSTSVYKMAEDGKVVLRHWQVLTNLTFGAVDYIKGQDYSYWFCVKKLHGGWRECGRDLEFTRLKPGTYDIEARYKDNSTGYLSPVETLTVQVKAVWYASTLAYVVYALIIIVLAGLVIRRRIKIHDIEKKAKLEAMKERLRTRQQNSMLNVMADIADECAVPVTLIYGHCQKLLEDCDLKEDIHDGVNSIVQNAIRLKNLSNILGGIGRRNDMSVELLNVSALTSAIMNPFIEVAEKNGCVMTTEIESSIVWGIDKISWSIMINQLTSFIVGNTLESGEIRGFLAVRDEKLSVRLSSDRMSIPFEVIDEVLSVASIFDYPENDGCGARPGDFNVFMLRELAESIGANLAAWRDDSGSVCLEIRVWPSQVSGNGIPVATDFIEENFKCPEIESVREGKGFDPSKKAVLVMDGGNEISRFIVNALENEFNVIFPGDPEAAMESLARNHPDLIICGGGTDSKPVVELLTEVKDSDMTRHIPVILIIFSHRHTISKSVMNMADVCITIPFELDTLNTAIVQLINRNDTLKDYYKSPQCNYKLSEGRLIHKEDKDFLDKIYKIIAENISNPELSPKFIAAEMNVGLRNMYRRIDNLMDDKLSVIIKDYRLTVAADLLVSSKMTVDEVIYRTGFVNRGTFYRLFNEKYGTTPKKFTKASQGRLVSEDIRESGD